MRYTAVVENTEQIDEAVTSVYRQLGQFENLFKNLGGVNDGFPQEIDLAALRSQRRGVQCHRPGRTDADQANTTNTFAADFIEVVDDRQQIADALTKQRLSNVCGHVADPV